MSLPALDNLVRIGQLKAEPPNVQEAARMLAMARTRLADARLPNLSLEGRFTSAYNAAYSAALAALRWHGYRSENRYTVFQCLAHTVNWPPARWRVLDSAHQRRNLNEYEGYLEVDASFNIYVGNNDSHAKLAGYAARIGSGAVYKRLGFLLQRDHPDQIALIESCRGHLSAGYAKLDPALPADRLVTAWRVWVPASEWREPAGPLPRAAPQRKARRVSRTAHA